MRILGIDFGEKRVGLAISDESQTLARELDIFSPKDFFKKLPELEKEYELQKIVLGQPKGMSGQVTQKTLEAEEFKKKIEKITSVPVFFQDERLSTSMAEKLPGGGKNKDSLAAQIILQNFLDQNSLNKNLHE